MQPARRVERRHLTVLFCDLVDSTRLSSRVDPEDWHHAMGLYRETVTAAISKYAGYVAQFQGDGVIAYFGFPVAHEDDASRSVRAALAILAALDELSRRTAKLGVTPLAVRIGIHTGVAVVEKIEHELHRETTAIGTTANVAARIQSLAEPNCILVSDTVRRLTAGEFLTRDLGIFALKGVERPPRVHSVIAASGVRSRLKAAEQLTPFVGRERELDLLLEDWKYARAGSGRAVLVEGEAGIGKSRLVLTLQQRLADQPHTWLECRASTYTRNAAFAPIAELIRQGLEISDSDDHEASLAKISRRAARDGVDAAELSGVFSPLIGLSPESPAGAVDPEARARTMRIILEWTLSLARTQPVVLLVEDLHWCDSSTVEFLEQLVHSVPTSPVLVLMTTRPDFEVPEALHSNVEHVHLRRLPKTSAREMLELAYDGSISGDAAEAIVARADGIPLYVEELARMVVETSRHDAPDTRDALDPDAPAKLESADSAGSHEAPIIPETLQDLLTARLDQLAEAKDVAQLASVIGREVPLHLLEQVSRLPAAALNEAITRLVDAGILFTAGTSLLFKHALIQDAAYQSMLRVTRRHHHSRIGDELVESFPDIVSTRPEVIAHHYTEARRPIEATDFWIRAGKRALEYSANVEAIAYAEKGMALVDQIPNDEARLHAELGLQLVLGPSLMASRGYADPSMEKAYGRARELCHSLGDPPALFPVMFGLWTFHCVRARHEEAAAIARDMTALAERDRNDSLLLEADVTAGITYFYTGNLSSCRMRLERALALHDPVRDADHCLVYGQDPRSAALAHLMLVRWTLGDVDGARKAGEDAIALAGELTHPFSIAYVLSFAAWLQRLRGDPAACLALADKAIEVCGKRTLAVFLAISEILKGSALVSLGQHDAGLECLDAGFDRFTATASTLIMPFWCCLRAQAYSEIGRIDDGLVQIEEAIERIRHTGERHSEAEAYRIRAMLRRASASPAADVESDLRHAIAVAGSHGASSWQLRAAIALCTHLSETTRRHEGVALLRDTRATFVPSNEPDVRTADSLLADLTESDSMPTRASRTVRVVPRAY